MPFKLLPATTEDADELAAIAVSVLAAYERLVIEFGKISPDDTFKFIREGMKTRLAFSKLDPDTPFIKLVDEESGEIAGYAIWGFSKDSMKRASSYQKLHPISEPKGLHRELRKRFYSGLEALDQKNFPSTGDYFVLDTLVTSAKFGRRGCGSQLVNWGLDRADREVKVTVLDASPQGYGLYKKLGFKEVDRLVIPLAEFGGSGDHVHVSMRREPNSSNLRN